MRPSHSNHSGPGRRATAGIASPNHVRRVACSPEARRRRAGGLAQQLPLWALSAWLATNVHALELDKVVHFSDSTRFSPPALGVDGKVYVGIQDFGIGMYDPQTGVKKQEALGGSVVSGPTIGHDGRVYVGINAGGRANFFALNPQTLAREWAVALQGSIATSAAVGWDAAVFLGTATGEFYRLQAHDGRVVWRTTVGGVTCSPVVGKSGAVYVGHGESLVALDVRDGRIQWRHATGKGKITTTPALGADGTLYGGDNQGVVRALTPGGALRWSRDLGRAVISGLTVGGDGSVFVGVAGPFVHALGPDGSLRWSQRTEGEVRNAPVVSNNGELHLVEGRYAVTRGTADGRLLIRRDRRGVLDDRGIKVTVNDWGQVGDGLLTHQGIFWFSNGNYLWSYRVDGRLCQEASYPMGQGDLGRSGRMRSAQARVFLAPTALPGAFECSLLGVAGKTYHILQSANLRSWTSLGRFTTHNGIVPLQVPRLTTPSQRFYKAIELP